MTSAVWESVAAAARQFRRRTRHPLGGKTELCRRPGTPAAQSATRLRRQIGPLEPCAARNPAFPVCGGDFRAALQRADRCCWTAAREACRRAGTSHHLQRALRYGESLRGPTPPSSAPGTQLWPDVTLGWAAGKHQPNGPNGSSCTRNSAYLLTEVGWGPDLDL